MRPNNPDVRGMGRITLHAISKRGKQRAPLTKRVRMQVYGELVWRRTHRVPTLGTTYDERPDELAAAYTSKE